MIRHTSLVAMALWFKTSFCTTTHVTIEHGHGNVHPSDYSSTGYWYQTEPHSAFPALLPLDQRLPIPDRESPRQYWKSFWPPFPG